MLPLKAKEIVEKEIRIIRKLEERINKIELRAQISVLKSMGIPANEENLPYIWYRKDSDKDPCIC